MQACIYEEYGAPDVVRVANVAMPRAKPDEVLVRVSATSVTTADWRGRASVFPKPFWLPGRLMLGLFRPRNPILGMDFSGVVEATGAKVRRFKVGDRVFGSTSAMRRGAHAEYLTVQESGDVVHKPASLSHIDAAAMPFGANTALAFLRDFAKVAPGQRVAIVGASGGVGSWAVQLARHFGAEVTAICSARNAEFVRALGATHVLDYAVHAFEQAGQTYDLIFDTVGATDFASCRRALSDQGLFLPLNGGVREMMQSLFTSRRAGKRVKFAISQNSREGLEYNLRLIEKGTIKAVVDQVYPLSQIAEAHRHVESRHKRGSVIVSVATLPE